MPEPHSGVFKRIARGLLNVAFARRLRDYRAVKPRRRFTDRVAALAILEPLMRNAEDAHYHRSHLERYLTTLEFLADLPATLRVLEVGAPPYGMTLLLKQWLFADLAISGFDEKSLETSAQVGHHRVALPAADGQAVFEADEATFNLESNRWPYADESFDLVMACETFEHLGLDPMHAYAEANRVLRPGGRLFVTVPNGIAISAGVRYLQGKQANSLASYRPEGYSLRHPREPTPAELRCLLESAGFEPEWVESFNVAPPQEESLPAVLAIALLGGPVSQRRELVAARGIKRGAVAERYPTAHGLYYWWDVERLRREKIAAAIDRGVKTRLPPLRSSHVLSLRVTFSPHPTP